MSAVDERRTIAAITTSRADYAHLYWVLRELRDHPSFELRLIAIGGGSLPGVGPDRRGAPVSRRRRIPLASPDPRDVGLREGRNVDLPG